MRGHRAWRHTLRGRAVTWLTYRPVIRFRWLVATALNRLPGQCWTDLVMWVLRDRGLNPWSPQGASCRAGLAETGACYCGKLRDEERLAREWDEALAEWGEAMTTPQPDDDQSEGETR